MGCFNEVDAVTNLPISAGDTVVKIITYGSDIYNAFNTLFSELHSYEGMLGIYEMIQQAKELNDKVENEIRSDFGKVHPSERIKARYYYVKGEYDDYGGIEGIETPYSLDLESEKVKYDRSSTFFLAEETFNAIQEMDIKFEQSFEGFEQQKEIAKVFRFMRLNRLAFPYAPGNFGPQHTDMDEVEAHEQRLKITQDRLVTIKEEQLERQREWEEDYDEED